MQAKPVPFIQIGDDGTLEVRKEAMQSLENIREPLHVVAVAGLYRTGKSFLLNQLLGHGAGFKIGHTVEACTKGLWLWGQPVRVDGKLVLFLDTEGIASVDQHGTNDVKVFALSILLSSFFVYNSMGTIDESAIDRLSLVVELTKHIRSRSEGEQSLSDLSLFFPSFMWLVRDHVLSMEKDGREMTAPEYLEWALQPGKRHETNKVRESIKQLFRDRDCFTLVRPVIDERNLQRASELSPSELRPEFRESMESLKGTIFSNLRSKQLYGKAVNGPMFLELAQQYVKAMNEGAVPTVATAWENVMITQCEKAVQAGIATYKAHFKGKSIAVETPDAYMKVFESMHLDAEKAAWDSYRNIALGDEQGPYEERLRDEIKENYTHRYSEVKHHVDSLAQMSVDGIVEDIEKKLSAGNYTSADNLREDIQTALTTHCKTASVALTGEVLLKAISTRILPMMVRLTNSLIQSEKTLAESKVRDATVAAEAHLAEASKNHIKEVNALQLLEKDAKLKLESATQRVQELQGTIAAMKSENDKRAADYQTTALTSNKLQLEVSRLTTELERLRNECDQIRCDRDVQEKVKNDFRSNAANAEQQVQTLSSELLLARTQIKNLEEQVAVLKQSQEVGGVTSLPAVGSKRGRDVDECVDVDMEDSPSPPKKAKASPASSSKKKITPQEKKKLMEKGKKEAKELMMGQIRSFVNVQRKRGCDVQVPEKQLKPEKKWRDAFEAHYACGKSDTCLLLE